MDLSTIQSAIATLGFPIVCVIAMGWFIWKLWNRFQEQNEKREEKLYAVIISAQAQNDALSKTNAQFVAVLENYQKDLEGIKEDVTDIKVQLQTKQ
jgi:cell division protein FtsB